MKARVSFYPEGLPPKVQLKILGKDEDIGLSDASVLLDFFEHGIGTILTLTEALSLGLTAQDLKAAAREAQEYTVLLQKSNGKSQIAPEPGAKGG